MPRSGWLAAILVLGCTPTVEIPDGAQLQCDSDADCPAGFFCRDTVNICVQSDQLGDITAPELVGTPVLLPAVGKEDTELTISFAVNEPLSVAPVVTAELRTTVVTWQLDESASAGENYVYTYTATGDEPEGVGRLFASFADRAGNQARGVSLGTMSLDFQPPVLVSARPGAAAFKAGDLLVYTINVSEPLRVPAGDTEGRPQVVVRTAGVVQDGFFSLPAIETDTSFTWTRSTVGLSDGAYTVEVSLEDAAGNTSGTVAGDGFDVDGSMPLASALAVAPARLRSGDTLNVSFDVGEALPPSGVVVLAGDISLTCGAYQTASPNYTCTHLMTLADIPEDTDSAVAVVVGLTDAAGNRGTASELVTFDSRPPGVGLAAVAYGPAGSNPLSTVVSATVGTTITVVVFSNERLDTLYPLQLTATHNATTVTFDLDPGSLTDSGAAFTLVVPSGTADGIYVPNLDWSDAAGNLGQSTFATPAIVIKTSIPTLLVDQNEVSFWRSPWGNAASECLCPTPAGGCTPLDDAQTCVGHFVPAGAYFALAPSDPLLGIASLAVSTFSLGTTRPAQVRVFTAADKLNYLGRLEPNEDDSWPRQQLAGFDTTTVYVTGVDEAGNESAPVKIDNVEWVASKGTGQSPHALETTIDARQARAPYPDLTIPMAGSEGAGADATAVAVGEIGTWFKRGRFPATPTGRYGHGMAYDSARGRVVLFGGEGNSTLGDLWEWDGQAWFGPFLPLTRPGPRSFFSMAYDSGRGRVVMFGGYKVDGDQTDEVWEWDGATWFGPFVPTLRPSVRDTPGMVYDSARRCVVLFGGYNQDDDDDLDDIWEWDGETWFGPIVPTTRPATRHEMGLAYDSDRGRVIMFGGIQSNTTFNDLWEWDGEAQTWSGPVAAPVALDTRATPLAYDVSRQRTVLFSGHRGLTFRDEVWEWNGFSQSWSNPTAPPATRRPTRRYVHALVYDSARKRVLTFGGYEPGFALPNDTWEWDGTTWWGPVTANGPGRRSSHAAVYDSGRGRVVLYGGSDTGDAIDDLWEWDGSAWFGPIVPGTRPPARYGHAMAYDSGRGRVVVFGSGDGTYGNDTWEWDGTDWFGPFNPTPRPISRTRNCMTYDSGRGRVVVFGGTQTPGTQVDDVWEWDGAGQTWYGPYTPTPRPPVGDCGPLAYDADRGLTVLMVGDSIWEWNGTAQTWDGPLAPTVRPSGVYDMTYDSDRNRVVAFGGEGVWEWNGASQSWSGPSSPSIRPAPNVDYAFVYDSARGRAVLVGGETSEDFLWEWDSSAGRRPAVQLSANFSNAGFASSAVEALTVRAHCGGDFSPFDSNAHGAALLGWSTGGAPPLAAGSWEHLEDNTAGATLPAVPGALLFYGSSNVEDAQRYLVSSSSLASFRCEPAGDSGTGAAKVALDYMEIRLRYQAP